MRDTRESDYSLIKEFVILSGALPLYVYNHESRSEESLSKSIETGRRKGFFAKDGSE